MAAGDPWRLGAIGYYHQPPFYVIQFSDLELPHLWDVVAAFGQPFQRSGQYGLANTYSIRPSSRWLSRWSASPRALVGIVLASSSSTRATRARVRAVRRRQPDRPIVALAPMIVAGFGRGLQSIVVIATYLTFFPVTIAMTRGLRSPDPARWS